MADRSEARLTFTRGGKFLVAITPDPNPIPFNQPFRLVVDVMDAETRQRVEGVRIQVNAWMPAHGHDMGRRPRVTRRDDGLLEVEGMLFAMRGDWQVQVNVFAGPTSGQALVDYTLGFDVLPPLPGVR